jgi:hypothetical protein
MKDCLARLLVWYFRVYFAFSMVQSSGLSGLVTGYCLTFYYERQYVDDPMKQRETALTDSTYPSIHPPIHDTGERINAAVRNLCKNKL